MIIYTLCIFLCSTETLSVMIRQLLPETLEFLANVNTKHSGAEYTSWSKSQAYGFSETQCFLNLLSAVLEKNAPKIESSSSYAGTSSFGSRGSSRMSSRASSVMTSYRYKNNYFIIMFIRHQWASEEDLYL